MLVTRGYKQGSMGLELDFRFLFSLSPVKAVKEHTILY